MNLKSHEADRFLRNPPKHLVAVLIYGSDQGLVRERADAMTQKVVPDLHDPFRIVEIEESALISDGARLFDEAAAISMLGGRRVIRVRRAGNGLAKLFQAFLDEPRGDALVVVEAGELAKGAALRKAFEDADNAAAIACYPDNARDLADVVQAALKAYGLRIAPEALDDAVSRLGGDRGITRSEIEKLALYMEGKQRIEIDDVRAVLGDQAEARVDELCDATGEANLRRLDSELERIWSEGSSAVAVIRQVIGHFQRLLIASKRVGAGEPIDSVLRYVRPPIHFSRANSFRVQLARWSPSRIEEALDRLLETEALCKTTGVPAEAACGRALFSIAALAQVR